ncbi:aldolase [Ectobacillus sp. JY-23]|uniref:aldolase n=1 Tax=Ectobacillus sp. JY-23 TaxID=2933872 RepID=UPI001FF47CEE|nr:aldolase [Ectobacillus sp. JY-23]UOY92714.1 aldolase [Ectobacillus sp. JY-23]
MITAQQTFSYKAFGFVITSEIALPELVTANSATPDISVIIEDSKVDSMLIETPYYHFVEHNTVRFYIPDVGSFLVAAGQKIMISPVEDADEGLLRLYVLGTCMGAILMQRRILPLHGSAVVIEGKAYAFIGESGAGKSTLASTLLQRGYQLLSDDVIAISLLGNVPFVTPSYPQQKLWQDSLRSLKMDSKQYTSIYGREDKYSVPVSSYVLDQVPLAGIFELDKIDNEEIHFRAMNTLEGLQLLSSHTYRNFLLPRLGLMEWHFQMSASIVNKIDVYQLHRPTSRFCAEELVAIIINAVKKEYEEV